MFTHQCAEVLVSVFYRKYLKLQVVVAKWKKVVYDSTILQCKQFNATGFLHIVQMAWAKLLDSKVLWMVAVILPCVFLHVVITTHRSHNNATR